MTHAEERCKNKIITVPNLLSLFRVCLIPVIVWQYTGRQDYKTALWLLILSGVTDVVDGIIARKYNMVSDFGKAFDPVADKLTQAAVLICLVTRFPNMQLTLWVLIVKELFMGITGLLMMRKGVVWGADWHGKAATVLLYATMILHLWWVGIPPAVSDILIGCCVSAIVLSGVLYGIRNLGFLRKGGRKPKQPE